MGHKLPKPLGPAETLAFMNFMKFYRKNHRDLEKSEFEERAINEWGKMWPDYKLCFSVAPRPRASAFARQKKRLAKNKLKKSRKSKFVISSLKSSLKSIKRSSIMKFKRKTSCSRRRSPALSKGFVTFLRELRQNNSNVATILSIQNGAREWMNLSEEHKEQMRAKAQKRKLRHR